MEHALEQPSDQGDRHQFVRQYWLRDQLGGEDPFAEALLICITAGLIWQFVLVLILTRRELGGLQRSRVREALWLLPPRDPKSARVGGRVWWWVLPFILIFALEALISIPGPSVRDFADFLDSDRGEDFFSGAWGWFAVVVVLVVFNTVHLHQPWTIPASLLDIIALAYPSRRFQSAWMGIIVHSVQSVIVIIVVLTLVLG